MIGASAEVAILKPFCIFKDFVSFFAEYTAISILFCLLLWKIRDISFQIFSIYFGVYNINSGLATSQFQLCQNSYQYSWSVLSAAAA